ncbi:MAG: penicillin-binding transpeptidase domain-containing protein [Bacteriovoracaceae bacterium]
MIKLSSIFLFPILAFANFNFGKDLSFESFEREGFKKVLSKKVFSSPGWPQDVSFKERDYEVEYSINQKLTDFAVKYLKRYRSDHASIVVMDNNTGSILTAVDFQRKGNVVGKSMAFSSAHPAASVFKVITAADLLENTAVKKGTSFSYNGKSTTLYKYQLKDKKNRWTRKIVFEKAFAWSNNVVFGKAAIKNTNFESLFNTAHKFGFNEELLQLLETGSSKLFEGTTDFNLAELATGFNRKTMISPLHGALIASIIANEGVLKKPYIVKSIRDVKQNREVWTPKYVLSRSMSKDAALELKDMMNMTVEKGTARGAFRPWKTKKIRDIEIGGKTGTITGGLPHGKRDWFISYAKPKDDPDDLGISVAIMIVNIEKWYIKSTYLAKKIIQYYYDSLKE